jgi:NADH-quinone oxidoreductase subunit K
MPVDEGAWLEVGERALLANYLVVGAILFAVGAVGFVSRRNLITVFLAAEIMLQGVSLSLVAWGRFYNDWGGQMLVLFIIAVAACEAAIALAMILMLFRRRGSLDVALWHELREDNLPPPEDREPGEPPPPGPPPLPRLTPAGRQPVIPREATDFRPRV